MAHPWKKVSFVRCSVLTKRVGAPGTDGCESQFLVFTLVTQVYLFGCLNVLSISMYSKTPP